MTMYSKVSMFIGWKGDSIWLAGGSEWADDHPIVAAYPDYFTDTAPAVPPEPELEKPSSRPWQKPAWATKDDPAAETVSSTTTDAEAESVTEKRKPGRPPGSKNRPKAG